MFAQWSSGCDRLWRAGRSGQSVAADYGFGPGQYVFIPTRRRPWHWREQWLKLWAIVVCPAWLLLLHLHRELLEKLIHHFFGGGLDEAGADGGNQSPDLRVRLAAQFGSIATFEQLNFRGALDET